METDCISENKIKKAHLSGGFTLVEILVTVFVLAFGCLAASKMLTISLKGFSYADNITVATFLAESELERLRALTFAELTYEATHTPVVVTNNINRLGQVCTPPGCDSFIFSRTVSFFPKTPTSFSHQIEIAVSWLDRIGRQEITYSGVVTSFSF
ncbi:MAG: prepilin-type N-terminal cleavage/methylation domain-containing protein [Deltaproteobacteria bacterium]|jgi:prepilin-type N-terminal cleavage/methylation domain-containing protein|nr:prepilin-type N-terminal cleavage/methylation domain-containing protein [Deltaproteobacteria bacterium]